jgi:cell division protein FtsZ
MQDLNKSPIAHKIQLGKTLTEGLGAGSNPEQGRKAAEESIEEIKSMLTGSKMVFIVAGMGGGTGTGAAPIIAKIAKDAGILTVAVVTTPYKFERGGRYKTALQGIEELKLNVDAYLVIKNENIRTVYGKLKVSEAENRANELLCTAVRSIAEIMTRPGMHNVDFNDVKSVMTNSGLTIMGTGRASGESRALQSAEKAINSPLLDYKIDNAKGLLINIVYGDDELNTDELEEIITYITEHTGDKVDMKYGLATDPELGNDLAVTIIVTGFETTDNKTPAVSTDEESPTFIHPINTKDKRQIILGIDEDFSDMEPNDEKEDIKNYEEYHGIDIPKKTKPILVGNKIAEISTPAVLRGKNIRTSKNNAASQYAVNSNNEFGASKPAYLTDIPD